MDFISYRDDLRGQIKRGARTPPDLLALRLESGATDNGTAVALVFVPRDYEPLKRHAESASPRASGRAQVLFDRGAFGAPILKSSLLFLFTPRIIRNECSQSAVSMSLVGSRLGPYDIAALLGAGGMGEVYKARDTRLDRTVAIKVIPADLAGDAAAKQRFEREARVIAALSHPHICALFDIGHQDGVDFLVMEYLEGCTLATRLSQGKIPLAEGLRYGIEIADALAALHRASIVHRDLKPGNIMITPSGAKLLDFGLAKLREQPAPGRPEQSRHADPGHRCRHDCWDIGVHGSGAD